MGKAERHEKSAKQVRKPTEEIIERSKEAKDAGTTQRK